MKKLFSMLLVVALAVTCFTTAAFAAGSASVSGTSKTAEAGDTVTLTFTVSGEFATYDMTIVADDGLTITGISGVHHNEAGDVTFYSNDGENVDSHSFEVTVNVSDDATPDTYNLTPHVAYVSDRDLNDLDVSVSAGKVIIEAPAHTHSYTSEVTKEPTCTEPGVKTYTCSCGDSYTEDIPVVPHSMKTEWSKDSKNHWHECSACGHKEDEAAHTWDNGVETVAPGKDTEGEMTFTCSVCGQTKTDSIPALGGCKEHKWNFNDLHVDVEPTCTEAGKGHVFCTECGERMDVTLDALGHTYDKNDYEYDEDQHWHVCDRCGEEIGHEDHVFNKHNGLCECGYKDPTWKPAVNPDDDDLPKTGDITAYITFAAATMICMVAAAGYVFKRNFLK